MRSAEEVLRQLRVVELEIQRAEDRQRSLVAEKELRRGDDWTFNDKAITHMEKILSRYQALQWVLEGK